MTKYVAEDSVQHVQTVFDTRRDAQAFAEAMAYRFKCEYQVYPQEPDTYLPNGQQEQYTSFNGMCECCLSNVAEEGDFLCMDCISRMLVDMESEDTDKY
jgi:hypothetical protein